MCGSRIASKSFALFGLGNSEGGFIYLSVTATSRAVFLVFDEATHTSAETKRTSFFVFRLASGTSSSPHADHLLAVHGI